MGHPGAAFVFELCTTLLAVSVLVQTLELLEVRRAFLPGGAGAVWTRAHAVPTRYILGLRLVACLLAPVLASGLQQSMVLGAMLVSSMMISTRFGGSYNGGSDSMTIQVALPLALGSGFDPGSWAREVCLAWIAFQVAASYAVSGWIKIVRQEWRDGSVLRGILGFEQYGVPVLAREAMEVPAFRVLAAWMVMGFELGFPIVFFVEGTAPMVLGLGVLFHLANVWLFGLNRFFWAWVAGYPAVAYWAKAASFSP